MIKNLQKKNKGFVILFAVTLSAILLSIALGATNIALKEIRFGTSAKDTNEAFFAADTGAECALFNDKSTGSAFPSNGSGGSVACASATPIFTGDTYRFVVIGLGSTNAGCAIVTVKKDITSQPPNVLTKIISKGYNIGSSACNSTSSNLVERELDLNY